MEEEIIGNRWKELGGVGHSGKSRMRARDPPPLTSSLPAAKRLPHKNHTINPKKGHNNSIKLSFYFHS